MMQTKWRASILVGSMLLASACSSSQTKESEDVIPSVSDAGTDSIPQQSVENLDGGPDQVSSQKLGSQRMRGPSSNPMDGEVVDIKVKSGDTLMKIAFEVYGDLFRWKEIYEMNKSRMSDPNTVPKGTLLTVPKAGALFPDDRQGEKYLIQTGDTLGKISNGLYGTPSRWKDLWENNKRLIRNPNRIFAGFYLYYLPTDQKTTISSAE